MSDQIQDAPVADATPAPEASTTEATPAPETTIPVESTETPPSEPESSNGFESLSDEELQAAIDAAISALDKPTEPVFFPEKQKEEVAKTELDSEIQALIQQKDSELAEVKKSLQEKQSQSEQIESAWSMLNQALPDLPDIITKLIAGEEDALPTFYRTDFQERLKSDTILWPLIEAHSRGEKPDYPGFVRSLAASKMKAMPKTSDAPSEPQMPKDDQSSNPANLLSKNKKTISLT